MSVSADFQNSYNNYFTDPNTPASMKFAGGTLTKGTNGVATWAGADGKTTNMTANSNIDTIAAGNPALAAQWNKDWGYTAPATAQPPAQSPGAQIAPPSTYTAAQTSGLINAAPASAVQDPSKGTVSGQVQGLIDANSPLMQRAASQGLSMANDRGLINSGMAIGSAQNAVLDHAVQIGSADAAANNQFSLTNAGYQQQVNMGNADTANKANILNTEATNASRQFDAQQTNALNSTQATLNSDTAKFNAQQQNAMVLNQLDQTNKIQLADIQATYQNQMQANQSSSTLFGQTMAAINNIQQSTTMDAATKTASVNQQISLLKSGLALHGAIANLNLAGVLNFAV